MTKYISCSNARKKNESKFLYFIFFCLFIEFFTFILDLFTVNLPSMKISFNKHFLIKPFLTYFGIFLCFIPELLINRRLFTFDTGGKKLTLLEILFLFIICIFLLINDFLQIYIRIKSQKEADYFYVDDILFLILFFMCFSIFIKNMKFYRHHILSAFIIVILSISRCLIQIDTFNFSYLLIGMINSFLETVIFSYINYLIVKKYFSVYKICFLIGLINCIILIIVSIIVSNIPCEKSLFCSFDVKKNIILIIINVISFILV